MSDLAPRLQQSFAFIRGRDHLVAPAVFFVLTVIVFNTGLIDASRVIGSALATDLPLQFLPWRKFGFDELSNGNLPLWNPHIYGGAPYFGGFQSAMLYPPNWLHLIFPVALAINWINALHVFAAGYFTSLWCRSRGLSGVASILAGVMFMFSGAYFPRVYAGHLPHLAIIVWAPLLFLSIDLLIRGTTARGTLLGIFVMAMFLLAGHPQYVYYTGMAAGLYVAINLFRFKSIPLSLLGCMLIVVGGTGLASMQLLTGLEAASESVRSGGAGYDFASMFSFPPENILTALSPNVFGPMPMDETTMPPAIYFGRTYLWEVCLFASLTGLILAIYGAIAAPFRVTRSAIALVVVCFILALGAHTPIHRLFYDYLPGFASFRGSAKFIYLVVLFVSLLAAYGFDGLQRAKKTPRALLIVAGTLLIVIGALALAIRSSSKAGTNGRWGQMLTSIYDAAIKAEEMNFIFEPYRGDDQFFMNAGRITVQALAVSALVLSAIIIILAIGRRKIGVIYLLIPLAIVELTVFAFSTRASTPAIPDIPEGWAAHTQSLPAHARILGFEHENLGMWMGHLDAWGYDPNVMKRYAELVWFSQSWHPKDATQYVQFHRNHFNIFPLLRIHKTLFDDPNEPMIPAPTPMNLAQLVPNAIVMKDRDEILWALDPLEFEPRETVILEDDPGIKLTRKTKVSGKIELIEQSTDTLEFKVDTGDNAILLITNAFSQGWRVRAVKAGVQDEYQVMPANWALQAVPLVAGQHHFILEYRPRLFVIGRALSIVSLLGYIGTCSWFFWIRPRRLNAHRIDSNRPPTGQALPLR